MSTHPAWIAWASRYPALRARLASWVPGLAAAASVLSLLFAFQQVVASGVANSQARWRVSAERADAMSRCNAGPNAVHRAGCRAQLEAAAPATLP